MLLQRFGICIGACIARCLYVQCVLPQISIHALTDRPFTQQHASSGHNATAYHDTNKTNNDDDYNYYSLYYCHYQYRYMCLYYW